MVRNFLVLVSFGLMSVGAQPLFATDDADYPRYKPSGRSPEALDIRQNSYGASRTAPDAMELGVKVPDFSLPRAGGGTVSLAEQRQSGPVVLIFYRGHW